MRKVAFVASLLMCASGSAIAAPWMEPGDVQVREDVERLKAARIINGPTNAWPLPWAVTEDLATAAEDANLAPELRASAKRLQAVAALADQPNGGEATVSYTDRPALIRDFGAGARQKVDGSVRVTQQLGNLFVSLGGGYRRHQLGSDWHLDQTYAAYKLGNWAVYGGYVDTWWGPGNSGSLLFSTSARPFPKIGVKRLEAHPINLPVLKWLGPWRFDLFVGDLGKRRDFDNAKVIAMRFDFAPAPGLEIGLNRALQLCGKNRPCSFTTVSKAVIGFGNEDNTGTVNEPGNQIAGYDISYTTRIGPVTARFYGEMEAEDEDNILIDKYARMAGMKLSGPVGGNGASWELGGEWTDTLAWELTTGNRFPGIVYRNFIYFDGFTYRDRPIGNSIDGDSKLISIDAAFTDVHNRRFYGSLRRAKFNVADLPDHRVSANAENINIGTLGVLLPTQFGDLRLEGRYMDNLPNTPGRSPNAVDFEASWRTRF